MSGEKQIEEMANVIESSIDGLGSGNFNFTANEISTMFAKALYAADYRKQSDVAREIFEEIKKCVVLKVVYEGEVAFDSSERFAEIKKKYTEEKT